MKDILRVLVTVSVVLAGCEGSTGPNSDSGEDTFSSNTLDRYTPFSDQGGQWSVRNGVLIGEGLVTQGVLIRNGVSMSDGWVEAEADHVDDGGLVLRFRDNANYYALGIRDDSAPGERTIRNLELYSRVQGQFSILWRTDVTWPRSAPRIVRFEAQGSTLNVYFEGQLLKSIQDTGIPGPGGIGVRHASLAEWWTSRYLRFQWRVAS